MVFGRTEDAGGARTNAPPTTKRKTCRNYLTIDALEMVEIPCRGGSVRRLCSRDTIQVPWAPSLFLAMRREYASQLRNSINFALMLRSRTNATSVIATRHEPLRGLVRARDRVLWNERRDLDLYELTFGSFRDRTLGLAYLRDNALRRTDDYLLFATSDNVAFEVALSSYVRRRRGNNGGDAVFSTGSSSSRRRGIDLSETFEMFSWCSLDVRGGNALTKLSPEELAVVGVPLDPFSLLPVISYDIETVANNLNEVPRGMYHHHRLSSIAFTVHAPCCDPAAVAMAYVPVEGDDDLLRDYEKRVLAALESDTAADGGTRSVMFYRDERQLLHDAIDILRTNAFLVDLYELDDPRDAERLACVLLGYNSWEYDYAFMVTRLHYFRMHRHAIAVHSLWREPRFNVAQISLDLMKHVAARHLTQVGSLALKHVSRFFGATERSERSLSERSRALKMNFDAVAIRRLYYRVDDSSGSGGGGGGEETFDENAAFAELNPDEGLNMLRVLRYNIQDCMAVYYLARELSFFDTIALYARHFFVSLVDASHVGNSRLLPNALAIRALCESRTILHYRDNVSSTFDLERVVASHATAAESHGPRELLNIVRERDSVVVPSDDGGTTASPRVSTQRVVANARLGSISDERAVMRIGDKSYLGGINSADSGHYEYPVAVDFASFYPSIGRQFGLSMETVRILTVQQLLSRMGPADMIDALMTGGLLRIFDYEPSDSAARRVAPLRGVDEMAAGTLANNGGWYEGVEFTGTDEIVSSSADVRTRRVLLVYRPTLTYVPVICGLWDHYLLTRKRYKDSLSELRAKGHGDGARARVCACLEKMFKVVANSLYGYLNYRRSVVYAPAVAAAITLLSRKIFHETAWICERVFTRGDNGPREVRVVYRDTDGLILHLGSTGEKDAKKLLRDQTRYESDVVRTINSNLKKYGYDRIAIEIDDAGTRICSIMGKKKYWKVIGGGASGAPMKIVTKGFEKNAQMFVKHLVRRLQENTLAYIEHLRVVSRIGGGGGGGSAEEGRDGSSFRLVVRDVTAFFCAVYEALDAYYRAHGVTPFAFGVKLNPRSVGIDSPEAVFIRHALTSYGYSVGDRAMCVFALGPDPLAARFLLLRDFDPARGDAINYYKLTRRLAVYFLQVVEGFKRAAVGADTVDDWPFVHDGIDLRMSARTFDRILAEAYSAWLANPRSSGALYAPLLSNDPDSVNTLRDALFCIRRNAADKRTNVIQHAAHTPSV